MKMPMKKKLAGTLSDVAEGAVERAEAGREMIAERAEMSREMMAQRAAHIRQQFAESYNPDAVTTFAGWTMVSTGLALAATAFMRGRRGFGGYIVPLMLGIAGMMVLNGRGMWQRRTISIDEAEARVREQLQPLDPVARFQVLRDVAGETVPFVKHINLRRN